MAERVVVDDRPAQEEAPPSFDPGKSWTEILGLDRVKSKDRPISQRDLQRLLDDVRARPFAYDEPDEYNQLIRKNRRGAQVQIATALKQAGLSIYGPRPMLTASTGPVFTPSPSISGPFDPRLPVPTTPEPMRMPRGGGVAVAIVVLENLYRAYESAEAEIERLETETARMGETEKQLNKRIKARQRELRREQRKREREIRRRERELGRERKQLAKRRARDVIERGKIFRDLGRRGARRPIQLPRVRIPDVAPSVELPPVRRSIFDRVGSAVGTAASRAGPIIDRVQRTQNILRQLGINVRRPAAPPVAAGFAVPAAPAAPVLAPPVVPQLVQRFQADTGAATVTDPVVQRCIDRAKRPKKKRKPRSVCYRGSYVETASGTRKRKREEIPCE